MTLDEQVSYYALASKHLGIKADVIVYDVLRKPQIEPKEASENIRLKKDVTPYKNARFHDETPEEYEERVLEKVTKDVAKYIVRLPVHRFNNEMKRFHLEVWNQAEMMRHSIENDFHVRNSHSCARHQGSVCEFLDVCSGMASLEDRSLFEKLSDVHPELGVPSSH